MTPTELALVLASAALHAFWSAWIKGSRDPVLFNFLQAAPGALLAIALLAASPQLRTADATFWAWVGAASVCHAAYLYWMARALAVADLSLVYPIARSTPAFLPFAAGPLLGERLSAAGAVGIAVVVAGMWCVQTRGRVDPRAWIAPGAGLALLTLAATVGYGVTDKAAMARLDGVAWTSPVPRSVAYFALTSLGGALGLVPAVARAPRAAALRAALSPSSPELRNALRAFAFSLVGYSLVLEALRSAPASYVVAVRQSSVLFAVALGVAWLRERPGSARIAGAVIICAGVALVAIAG
ncbi:MAG: EamA family transporter [Myxococcota bacterium]